MLQATDRRDVYLHSLLIPFVISIWHCITIQVDDRANNVEHLCLPFFSIKTTWLFKTRSRVHIPHRTTEIIQHISRNCRDMLVIPAHPVWLQAC